MSEANFYCKPAPGERIDTRLQLAPDTAAAIYGVVSDPAGAPIPAALALLFRVEEDPATHTLLAQAATDAEGHFAFGGLESDVLYRIKLFPQGGTTRTLEWRAE